MSNEDHNDQELLTELAQLLNKHGIDNVTNTPDFILAEYVHFCLLNFKETTNRRDKYFGPIEAEVTSRGNIRKLPGVAGMWIHDWFSSKDETNEDDMSKSAGTENKEGAFTTAVDVVLDHEGGYVNDPDDPGGETKFGISKRAYPDLDIANLEIEDAEEIYRRDYWNKCGGPDISDFDVGLAVTVLDHAINAGVSNAVKILQRLAESEVVDGIWGENTRAAVRNWLKNATLDQTRFDFPINLYTRERLAYYVEVSNFDKYGDGWFNRTISTHNTAVEETTLRQLMNDGT